MDRADAAGVAREMGVTGRPRKILYVTAGLRGGGAEAMLTRLVTAQPGLADEITLVSLLPAEGHIERLTAGGVRVLELQFDKMGGVAAGLLKLAKLIADSRPDIVQGWMYHGDLAALVALVMSGRRKQTRLVWSIRCSDMDLRHYGRGLRLVVKACTLLSSWPDLVTANSTAGLKSHLALGYRPRRAEVVAKCRDLITPVLGAAKCAALIEHVLALALVLTWAAVLLSRRQTPSAVDGRGRRSPKPARPPSEAPGRLSG